MIKQPTVFVLGAGASAPYQLPIGPALSKKIWENVWNGSYLKEIPSLFSSAAVDEATNFANSLYRSSTPIDDWLAKNPPYHNIGKYFIARAIIQAEIEDRILEGDWYAELWDRIRPTKLEQLSENRVSFITFNYDRSLEHALMIKARYTFTGSSEAECATEIQKIPVIHVHGQLGRLPWQTYLSLTRREYDPRFDPNIAIKCAAHIKIIGETNGTTPEYVEARKLLLTAEDIHFLGFGYNEDNMLRLRTEGIHPKSIAGTHLNLEEWKRGKLRDGNDNPFGFVINTDHIHASALSYVRNMVKGWGG